MKEVTITKENCTGYAELYMLYDKWNFPVEKYRKNLFIDYGILLTIIVGCALLHITIPFYHVIIGGILVAVAVNSYKRTDRKRLKEFKKQYPFLNYEITKEELAQLLEKENILRQNGIVMDVEGYIKKLETEKELVKYNGIKDNYIRETRFENIATPLMVPEEELQTAKQKIKIFTK